MRARVALLGEIWHIPAHNLKVAGSNPAPATKFPRYRNRKAGNFIGENISNTSQVRYRYQQLVKLRIFQRSADIVSPPSWAQGAPTTESAAGAVPPCGCAGPRRSGNDWRYRNGCHEGPLQECRRSNSVRLSLAACDIVASDLGPRSKEAPARWSAPRDAHWHFSVLRLPWCANRPAVLRVAA